MSALIGPITYLIHYRYRLSNETHRRQSDLCELDANPSLPFVTYLRITFLLFDTLHITGVQSVTVTVFSSVDGFDLLNPVKVDLFNSSLLKTIEIRRGYFS